jgi:hypothetical protein
VRSAARVKNRARVGKRLQKKPCAAGVIQVHVSEKNVIDRFPRNPENVQRIQQVGHGVICSDVDESRTIAVLNDVRSGMTRVQVLGVDGSDAVRMME